MVAHRHAPGDLDVDQLIGLFGLCAHGTGIVCYQFDNKRVPAGLVHRVGDAQLAQAAREPRHVFGKAERAPGIGRHDLVDTVSEDEAAVEHADLRVAQGAEFAVEVAQGIGQNLHTTIIGTGLAHAPSRRRGLRNRKNSSRGTFPDAVPGLADRHGFLLIINGFAEICGVPRPST